MEKGEGRRRFIVSRRIGRRAFALTLSGWRQAGIGQSQLTKIDAHFVSEPSDGRIAQTTRHGVIAALDGVHIGRMLHQEVQHQHLGHFLTTGVVEPRDRSASDRATNLVTNR
jgi:hypothetical protein